MIAMMKVGNSNDCTGNEWKVNCTGKGNYYPIIRILAMMMMMSVKIPKNIIIHNGNSKPYSNVVYHLWFLLLYVYSVIYSSIYNYIMVITILVVIMVTMIKMAITVVIMVTIIVIITAIIPVF